MADLVFDNTPLSYFARAGRLDLLGSLVGDLECATMAEVRNEIIAGIAQYPELAGALALPWLGTVALSSVSELVRFAGYKAELGGGTQKNVGEAAVLAWVKENGGVVLIDERAGSRLAHRDGVRTQGSLWLLVNGVRRGVLGRGDAEKTVDDWQRLGMWLPTDGEGLFAWAYQQGLLP